MRHPLCAPFFLAAPFLCAQTTYRVDADATGGLQNGSTWADAFTDLQAALAVAQYGDEVWVAEGTYLPTPGTDRHRSFDLKNGVRLLGGFGGTEDSAQQRDWALRPTRLSGNIGDPASPSDNSFHVVFGRGLDEHTALDGFSLNALSLADSYGAGMVLLGGPYTLLFDNNAIDGPPYTHGFVANYCAFHPLGPPTCGTSARPWATA
jgi:hypothetical protein